MTPPHFARYLLHLFCAPHRVDELEGDLDELFQERIDQIGLRKARWRYVKNVISLMRPSLMKRESRIQYPNPALTTMLRNYLKIAFRNLAKNRVNSFINIGGLAIGMAVAILIGLWVYDELSFNQYHQNYGRIARVMQHQTIRGETSTRENNPIPLGTMLRTNFKDDFTYVVMSTQTQNYIVASESKVFTQKGRYMQVEAPELLSLRMNYGSKNGLQELNSILLSQTLANVLFGKADPMGKLVKLDNKLLVKVTGVYQDFPNNSEFKAVTFIAPWDLMLSMDDYLRDHKDDWNNNFLHIYTQLAPHATFEGVSAKIKDLKLAHVDKEYAERKPALFLQPMHNWHLYSTYKNGVIATSEELRYVWIYSIIGVFVLVLACINFMNLNTARSEKRAKEVGIRKAVGSMRSQLINQFFAESLLTVAFAFAAALLLVQLALPWFNHVADKQIAILWSNPFFWEISLVFVVITGLFSGSYPALYLSSFKPISILKGTILPGRLASMPRKVLVVVQFSVSTTLIIGAIIVYRQIQYARDRPVGYSRENLIVFRKSTPDFEGKSDLLKTEFLKTGVVTEMAESSSRVTDISAMNGGFDWEGRDPGFETNFGTLGVSHDYGKTIGWQFVVGRDFSKEFATDSAGFILNEAAVKEMGLKNPIGETINWDTEFNAGSNFKVIGVVKDMVMQSPFEPIKPTIFFLQGYKGYIFAKIKPTVSTHEALATLETTFKKIIPNAPFDYKFVDDEYSKKFATEERIGKLASFFAVLAIFISCLGLFGLASFVAEQRTKEIGVRKVLGASVFSLWGLLSKDFVLLVIISLGIATPIAYYFLSNWLRNYAYRTELSWWIFAASGAGALIITLLTVSFQSVKAALMNPVKSLRSE
ncbi:FtsX-like permease family protein [Spirosoma sp. KCTC 42546]|uniref:ABC transporter permease n=1 Tax=Spirosoma sp. KCTC 42546 TaxID=2520506 RepID=UPI001159EAC3|nr:ABC transporter permease [Spirosoma sp. KCTC 42546]QDK79059.1 FtsX-like permease family protein [Spirosoma sp. KCTC 42546]